MARFQQSVVISRPAERVFAFVSDFENDPRWSGVTRVRRTSSGPVGVGTTLQLRQRFLGRHLEVVLEVVRYEPGRVITVQTTSGRFVSMAGTRLAEPADDATRLTFSGTGHACGLESPDGQEGGNTRARGTPPTRRDSRAASHGYTLKSTPAGHLRPPERSHERSRPTAIAGT